MSSGGVVINKPVFQFTHPRRVRLLSCRVRMGLPMFQFTHPRRVRPGCNSGSVSFPSFQFTHPRRVRLLGVLQRKRDAGGFNSRTRVGCDLHIQPFKHRLVGFNSRTRVGCD